MYSLQGGFHIDAMPFYGVAIGHCPGVYNSWDEAKDQVERFRNALHKKFSRRKDAEDFVAKNRSKVSQAHSVTLSRVLGAHNARHPLEQLGPRSYTPFIYFYAVVEGRVPGLYKSWEEAELQVKNFRNAKHKKFLSLEEAHKFMNEYKRKQGADLSHPHFKDLSKLVETNNKNTPKRGRSPQRGYDDHENKRFCSFRSFTGQGKATTSHSKLQRKWQKSLSTACEEASHGGRADIG